MPDTDKQQHADTREAIQKSYSQGADNYDSVRLENKKGRLLSDHDIGVVHRIFSDLPDDLKPQSVLEVGAGTGRFTVPMLEKGLRITATDINEGMLDLLRGKVKQMKAEDRCEVQAESIFDLSFKDNTFDFAFGLHVIPRFLSVEDQRSAILEVARTIKPGGVFLFNYRNSCSLYNLLYQGHAISPKQMQAIIAEAGMTIIKKRGKWFLTKSLINRLPLFAGKMVRGLDRILECVLPNGSWDTFILVKKQ